MTAVATSRPVSSPWPWFFSGALTLIFAFGLWVLGDRFVFGEGHAQRPIWNFLLVYAVGWSGLAIAAICLARENAPPMVVVLGVAMLARGLLLDSNLIQSSDVYRYVLDGETLVHGVNPYLHAPADISNAATGSLRSSIESEEARGVLDRVSYSGIRTVYPPLAQLAFAAGARLTQWSWMGQRIVFTACDIATIGVLIVLLTRLGLPRAWVVLYAWNPLILKEIVNSAHVDSLAALCTIGAIYTAVRGNSDNRARWPLLCGLVLSGAVLAKLYPLLLVPAFGAYWLTRTRGPLLAAAFFAVFVGGVVSLYLPFLSAGAEPLTEGFRRYAGEWRRNEGLFAILAAIVPAHSRAVYFGLVGMCAITGAFYILRFGRSVSGLIAVLQFTLLAWFLLLPAPYPWYATSLLAISVLRPRVWGVAMSGALAAYYYSFIHEYRGHPDVWLQLSQGLQHGLILITLAVSVVVDWRARARVNPVSRVAGV